MVIPRSTPTLITYFRSVIYNNPTSVVVFYHLIRDSKPGSLPLTDHSTCRFHALRTCCKKITSPTHRDIYLLHPNYSSVVLSLYVAVVWTKELAVYMKCVYLCTKSVLSCTELRFITLLQCAC